MQDAAGNIPAKLTKFETKWRNNIESGDLNRRYVELCRRQSLPIDEKINLSLERIHEWHEAFDGRVSVGYSGGKDSSVLLWLVRQHYADVPGVFCNTGLEYPEIVNLVKSTPNVTIVRPKIPFHHVIRDYGWPVVSKKVARGINILRNPTGNNKNVTRLYEQGINRFGESVNGFKVPARWRFLIKAPFLISDKCCEVMKKRPMGRYEKKTGFAQMIGTMASDSKIRQKIYLQTGCNAFDAKRPRSMPMGFWTEQDVLECIHKYKIPYADVYGQIVKNDTGGFKLNGVSSTGCIFCCFGLHMEERPNRFQLLRESHPHLYEYCMDRLGLKDVLDYMRDHCPDRHLRKSFNYEPYNAQKQMQLFSGKM
jgi:3'-phosphoadenosine 5'-phosphosulfate sulfotransferase (PAPS reductase)/FAD synthetase